MYISLKTILDKYINKTMLVLLCCVVMSCVPLLLLLLLCSVVVLCGRRHECDRDSLVRGRGRL